MSDAHGGVRAPRPLRRVLVANRGEIALRIQRACRELGLEVVQAHSEADRDSLPVRLADRAVCIGPPPAARSYLRGDFLVQAALGTGADAIHPGYGFLSENAAFARRCAEAGVTFVGPSPEAIAGMGDKAMARRLAREADVPTTPGSDGAVRDAAEAREVGRRVGYPLLFKAVAGGGGRGMRVVERESDLAERFAAATAEAASAFGDGALYVERFMPRVRHVEVQVLSDGQTVLHLGERDCSVQRRNQKLVEESPSPAIGEAQRRAIGEAAVRLCRRVGYTSAGTIECIADADSGDWWFMEMNTRIQVEHPVTEMVTGIDLVKAQLRIAGGEPLGVSQAEVGLSGHAIECRVNAEDPDAGFAPCPGTIRALRLPGGPGVRVDTHVGAGDRIPPWYDSMIAKILAWGRDRDEAIARMARALAETEIDGVKTTLPFHRALMARDEFRRGEVHTRFVEQTMLAAR